MEKIGIATPFKVPNYGTKLQAYAISTYMSSVCDGEVEILNYNPSSDRRMSTVLRKAFSLKKNIARIKRILNKQAVEKSADPALIQKRKASINSFDSLYHLSKPINGFQMLQEKSGEYDCLICGSDQIWLPGNLQDKYYTLEFCEKRGVKKGSYAASLGVETLTEKEKKAYSGFLSKLDFISVREDIGRDLLQSFFKAKPITWVCDPTFLLDKEDWEKLEQKPPILDEVESGYIFCYFLGTDESARITVSEYAKKQGLKILTVANFKGYCEADTSLTDIQLYDLSVNEFLYLIHHANLVCTDSMHATIFSIIFENQFVTFERFKKDDTNSRNSRIYSLLSVMGLEKRLIEGNATIPDESIDFVKVKPKRDVHINASKQFISREIL
jgi:hypothetical protein